MSILPRSFYLDPDVTNIARQLLGKYLVTKFDGEITSGLIVETEAYAGTTDRASHAFGGRFTPRTSVMYQQGGTAYVYLCYGIHSLFNVVTNREGIPHAVLIRGIIPVDGADRMAERTGKPSLSPAAGTGPGKVSSLLGIHHSMSGLDLTCPGRRPGSIWIEDRNFRNHGEILAGPRIGVDYAGEDAKLPYRFMLGK